MVAVPAVSCRSYSLLNTVSVNCVICTLHIAVTDSTMHGFVHFSSEENSQECCHQSCSLRLKYAPNRLSVPSGGAHSAPPGEGVKSPREKKENGRGKESKEKRGEGGNERRKGKGRRTEEGLGMSPNLRTVPTPLNRSNCSRAFSAS